MLRALVPMVGIAVAPSAQQDKPVTLGPLRPRTVALANTLAVQSIRHGVT